MQEVLPPDRERFRRQLRLAGPDTDVLQEVVKRLVHGAGAQAVVAWERGQGLLQRPCYVGLAAAGPRVWEAALRASEVLEGSMKLRPVCTSDICSKAEANPCSSTQFISILLTDTVRLTATSRVTYKWTRRNIVL